MSKRILAVDDDSAILELVSDTLTEAGFSVTGLSSGEEALAALEREPFDLVILDIMLGGVSGLEVCRRVRANVKCPILFLSAKSDIKDIVTGLGLGADDYMTKPFALEELTARVQAHLRRQDRSAPETIRGPIQIGDIWLDPESRRVTKNGAAVSLSTREFDLLAYLMSHAGETLSREKLFREVWGTDYGDVGAVAINIKNLRTKLDPEWAYIKTIWGSGYHFVTRSSYAEEQEGG